MFQCHRPPSPDTCALTVRAELGRATTLPSPQAGWMRIRSRGSAAVPNFPAAKQVQIGAEQNCSAPSGRTKRMHGPRHRFCRSAAGRSASTDRRRRRCAHRWRPSRVLRKPKILKSVRVGVLDNPIFCELVGSQHWAFKNFSIDLTTIHRKGQDVRGM